MREQARRCVHLYSAFLLAACATGPVQKTAALQTIPLADTYCLTAQHIVSGSRVESQLMLHESFDDFVKAKAVIDTDDASGVSHAVIHQYNWRNSSGRVVGFACKMNSADHLNLAFGEGSAGPEGYCHDMNEQMYGLLNAGTPDSVFSAVVFDASERLDTKEQANMIGPLWLDPFTLTYADNGELHIATKGFVIRFDDPRYQKFPPSWRGTHYCHLVAPDYLQALLTGIAEPGAVIGRPEVRGYTPVQGEEWRLQQ